MNSTTSTPASATGRPADAAADAVTTEYTHSLGINATHVWNIRSSSAPAPAPAAVSDFYLYENLSSVNNGQTSHTHINKSFPRHHALVRASLGSANKIIERDVEVVCRKRYTNAADATAAATARAHDTRSVTYFTDLSAYQKQHLVSMSGLAGLLVSRWMGVRNARSHTINSTKKHAELTAKYIHSALACESLVANRYYRDLPRIVASMGHGGDGCVGSATQRLTPADITPENVAATKTELMETYTAQIDRLLDTVRQYKRGFVSLHTIRDDPEFVRLMSAYWRYCKQIMKVQNNFDNSRDSSNEHDNAKRLFVVADVCAVSAMVPQLYNYDIAHLFDGANQSYAKFVKTAKGTLVRLSNDGLTAAFLSFAAVEPRAVTAEMAPKHGMTHLTTTLMSCANHIPTRDPLYGALRMKHRDHIPRVAVAVAACKPLNEISRCPMKKLCVGYTPLQDTIDYIRVGRGWSKPRVITSASQAYAERLAVVAVAQATADAADGWSICSRKRKQIT